MKLAWNVCACSCLAVAMGCSRTPTLVDDAVDAAADTTTDGSTEGPVDAADASIDATPHPTDGATDGPADASAPQPGDGAIDSPSDAADAAVTSPGDAAADTNQALAGRYSFSVTAMVMALPNSTANLSPFTHRFTIVIDLDARTAIVGSDGTGSIVPVTVDGNDVRITSRFRVSVPIGSNGSVYYDSLTLTLDQTGGLSGSGNGSVVLYYGDTGQTSPATMTVAGVPDKQPPSFVFTSDGDVTDPFSPFSLSASEPLPPSARSALIEVGGVESALTAYPDSAAFITSFTGPGYFLRYGRAYRVVVAGIADFAGNVTTTAETTFTTRPAPPLIAEDGFESETAGTLGGADVIVGSDAIIAGTHSLYLPPIGGSPMPGTRARTTRLAVRLGVVAGDTVVRFAYRVVNPSGLLMMIVAIEGGKRINKSIAGEQATTVVTIPGKGQVSVGPVATAEIPLPPGVTNEIVVGESVLRNTGGLPLPPVSGLIIDDLRVE